MKKLFYIVLLTLIGAVMAGCGTAKGAAYFQDGDQGVFEIGRASCRERV